MVRRQRERQRCRDQREQAPVPPVDNPPPREAPPSGTWRRISTEMHRTASDLGITIVGGHTELTPGLRRPIVVTTAFAFAEFVRHRGRREGRGHHNAHQERRRRGDGHLRLGFSQARRPGSTPTC